MLLIWLYQNKIYTKKKFIDLRYVICTSKFCNSKFLHYDIHKVNCAHSSAFLIPTFWNC